MPKHIELTPLLTPDQSKQEQWDKAREVQQFIYEDSLRVGANERQARSVADPDDINRVDQQLARMNKAAVSGAKYVGVLEAGRLQGIAKVGSWLYGDEAPYGRRRMAAARQDQLARSVETLPSGLHAFAVRQGLAHAALQAVYLELVAPSKELIASVNENDDELQRAFTDLGAPEDGPKGTIKLGKYKASYVRRTLPPRA